MSRQIHLHEHPDRFVAGTVGLPGERTFYLQVRSGSRVTSVALEKTQVAVLADRVDQLLDEVAQRRDDSVPPRTDVVSDVASLDVPLMEEFRVGAMSLGWDDARHRMVIEAHAIAQEGQDVPEIDDDSDTEGPDTMRVWLDAADGRTFAARARQVVAAGRPPCPLCLQPLDPSGHICPRANGYRRQG